MTRFLAHAGESYYAGATRHYALLQTTSCALQAVGALRAAGQEAPMSA